MMCAMEPTSLKKRGKGVVVDGPSFLFEAFRARKVGERQGRRRVVVDNDQQYCLLLMNVPSNFQK